MKTEPSYPMGSPSAGLHSGCLGLGSNVDPASNLAAAVRGLRLILSVEAVSTAWQSAAVGVEGADYVNAALVVRTALAKDELVRMLKRTEEAIGRNRNTGGPPLVPIDIDLLVFDGIAQKMDLWALAYRAVPVAELLPGLASPVTAEPISAAASRLSTETRIFARPDILRVAARPRAAAATAATDKDPDS